MPVQGAATHYEILGVPENASLDEIKRAYRKRVKEIHPDRNGMNGVDVSTLMTRLHRARAVLCDPQQRKSYDELLITLRAQDTARPRTSQSPRQQRTAPSKPRSEGRSKSAAPPFWQGYSLPRISIKMVVAGLLFAIGLGPLLDVISMIGPFPPPSFQPEAANYAPGEPCSKSKFSQERKAVSEWWASYQKGPQPAQDCWNSYQAFAARAGESKAALGGWLKSDLSYRKALSEERDLQANIVQLPPLSWLRCGTKWLTADNIPSKFGFGFRIYQMRVCMIELPTALEGYSDYFFPEVMALYTNY